MEIFLLSITIKVLNELKFHENQSSIEKTRREVDDFKSVN
jgi:hypothetical protein